MNAQIVANNLSSENAHLASELTCAKEELTRMKNKAKAREDALRAEVSAMEGSLRVEMSTLRAQVTASQGPLL